MAYTREFTSTDGLRRFLKEKGARNSLQITESRERNGIVFTITLRENGLKRQEREGILRRLNSLVNDTNATVGKGNRNAK